jgi:hypothetical protein
MLLQYLLTACVIISLAAATPIPGDPVVGDLPGGADGGGFPIVGDLLGGPGA